MVVLNFGNVKVLEYVTDSEKIFRLELPKHDIEVDLFPLIDMNNPDETIKEYEKVVKPLKAGFREEGLNLITAYYSINTPLNLNPGLLPKEEQDELVRQYPTVQASMDRIVKKYDILDSQTKLMNENIGVVNVLGDYVDVLNYYVPKYKSLTININKLLTNINNKLEEPSKPDYQPYLYN